MSGVVVGIDDSKPARAALRWALRYAWLEGLPVTVLTVVDPLFGTALWDTVPPGNTKDAALSAAQTQARQMVDEACAQGADDQVDVEVKAVIGHPVKELVEAAEGAQVLVVGSRGAGPFGRLLLGSTSSGVAHHAPCSVMIVRDSDLAVDRAERSA